MTDIPQKKKKVKVDYLDKVKMFTELVKYKTQCEDALSQGKERPQIPRYLAECIMLIANNLGSRYNFYRYTYIDEMIDDAIENGVTAIHSFDPDKGKNPHAYFTMIMWRAFLRRIAKEKRHLYTKYKIAQAARPYMENEAHHTGEAIPLDNILDNPYMIDLVNSIEKTKEEPDAEVETDVDADVSTTELVEEELLPADDQDEDWNDDDEDRNYR